MNLTKLSDRAKRELDLLEERIVNLKRTIRDGEQRLIDHREELKETEQRLRSAEEAIKAGQPVICLARCKYCWQKFAEGIEDQAICSTCAWDYSV